ncbi:unnamed protein product [Phaeothamnion confervicola]
MTSYKDAVHILMAPPPATPPPVILQEEETDDTRWRRRKAYFCGLAGRVQCSEKVFHVAGTKGKGSVCEVLRCSLVEAGGGRRVGTFTSPHMHTVRERIRVGEDIISKENLSRLTAVLQGGVSGEGRKENKLFPHPRTVIPVQIAVLRLVVRMARASFKAGTAESSSALADLSDYEFSRHPWMLFFDKLLAVALCYFAEQQVDWMVLEVGIGGRYDSTNFAAAPAACVVASISLDHQGLLGTTLPEIAWQKAGVAKRGRPLITHARQRPEVLKVIAAEVAAVGAELHVVDGSGGDDGERDGLPSYVVGENIALASAALRHVGLRLCGMERFYWPGRFEVFRVPVESGRSGGRKPAEAANVATAAPAGEWDQVAKTVVGGIFGESSTGASAAGAAAIMTVIVDGAHNEDSVEKVLETVRERFFSGEDRHGRRLLAVFGASADKNVGPMLARCCDAAWGLALVAASNQRAATSAQLLELLPRSVTASLAEGKVAAAGNPGVRRQVYVLRNIGGGVSGSDRGWECGGSGADGSSGCDADSADPEPAGESLSVGEGIDVWLRSGHAGADFMVVCGSLAVAAAAREHIGRRWPSLLGPHDWVHEADQL